jgi:S1-C subfamily serine protease
MSGPASTLRRVACVAALLAALQGCATTGQPAQQSIWIETPDCASASCELRNDRGQWTLERTPGRVTVTTSSAPLEVACRAGELTAHASAPSTVPPVRGGAAVAGGLVGAGAAGGAMSAATAGAAAIGMATPAALAIVAAAVLGGLAGAGIGAGAEAATRAIAYPERITVPLRCDVQAGERPRIGVVVRGVTPEEALRAGLPGASAVWVLEVAEGSPAAAAGLRAGDVVLFANGIAVDSAASLEALVRTLAPESALTLQVRRDGALVEVRLLPATVR